MSDIVPIRFRAHELPKYMGVFDDLGLRYKQTNTIRREWTLYIPVQVEEVVRLKVFIVKSSLVDNLFVRGEDIDRLFFDYGIEFRKHLDKLVKKYIQAQEKPRYKHDCSSCQYLGQDGRFDLYYCGESNSDSNTLIARFSDYGPDYYSGMHFGKSGAILPLATAYKRAKERGLIKE